MTTNNCDTIFVEVERLGHDVDRIEKVLGKLEENNTKLTTLCSEIKAMTAMNVKRIEHVERDLDTQRDKRDLDRVEFNRSLTRIHDKIESSEDKNERKIDDVFEKLSDKIDGLCDKSGQRIDRLTARIDKFDKYKYLIGGALIGVGAMLSNWEFIKHIIAGFLT